MLFARELVEVIKSRLRLKQVLYEPHSAQFGDGSMNNNILSGKIDIFGSLAPITGDLQTGFLYPIHMSHLYYYSRYPIKLEDNWLSVLQVFNGQVLLVLFITLGLFGFILMITYVCYTNILHTKHLLNGKHHPTGNSIKLFATI